VKFDYNMIVTSHY